MTEEKPLKRDDMHRCPYCKKLFPDKECQLDPVLGLICPNGCKKEFTQPPYELPLNDKPSDDSTTKTNKQEM